MPSQTLTQIEKVIARLSREEQLWLIEGLVHRLQEGSIKRDVAEQTAFESQLTKMAKDPEIRDELRKIEREFALTEIDGLDGR